MSRQSLDVLLRHIARRDRAAFDALYERTSAKLFGVCLRILENEADAQDALHDAYVKIWLKSEQFDSSRASAIAWMCAIARNASIDRLRARPRATKDLEDAAEVADDDSPSPVEAAEWRDDVKALSKCLDELETTRSIVIRAAFLSGLTYADLSAELGKPVNTVKSWIRRGLKQLRRCLER